MLRIVFGFAIALVAVVGIAAAALFVSASGRYELAVDLELDGKRYSGATVWEMSIWAAPEILPAPAIPEVLVTGDAIDLPMEDGRTLFILKRDHLSPPNEAYGRKYLICLPGEDIRGTAKAIATFDGSCDIQLTPKIVIADENGVLEEVPYNGSSGHRLQILSTVATGTRAPVTRGIEARHPWIARLPSDRSDSRRIPYYTEDFSRR